MTHTIRKCIIPPTLLILLLAGCLGYDTYSLSLDMGNKTGTAIFGGLYSDSTTENGIEKDFQSLLETFSGDGINQDGPFEIVSKDLFSDGQSLNAKIVFRCREESVLSSEILKEFGIQIDAHGDYVAYEDGKEEYVKGNGSVSRQGARQIIRWPGTAARIEFETRRIRSKDVKITSLYSSWLRWKEANP